MLQSFLTQQNSSLLNQPPSKDSQKTGRETDKQPVSNSKEPQKRHKRKKIFEHPYTQESIVTAQFKGTVLEESKVESYKIPSVIVQEEQPKMTIRKVKGSKQNCLFLGRKDKPSFQNGYLKSMETIPSTTTDIMPQHPHQIQNKVSFGDPKQFPKSKQNIIQSQGSLQVDEDKSFQLTFSSYTSIQPLDKQNSKKWMGSKVQSQLINDF